jgi:hypothetical protein
MARDGTGIYSFSEPHCEHCLTRTDNGKTTDDHYLLEDVLVTSDGFSFSLMSELIENPQPNPTKQDGEWKAFDRLAERLKKRFPRLPICLSLAGLFACGPVFARGHDYTWRYLIVLKEDDLPSVYHAFLGLAKLQPEGQLKERILKPVEINRNFPWVNGIAYRDAKNREHLLNLIELKETPRPSAHDHALYLADRSRNHHRQPPRSCPERREGSLDNRESRL